MGEVADNEAYTVDTQILFPSSSDLQLAGSIPVSIMSLVYPLHAYFSFFPQASDVGETHTLIPVTAHPGLPRNPFTSGSPTNNVCA